MYNISPLGISDVLLLESRCFEDDRGYYAPTFSRQELQKAGISEPMIEEGHSRSREPDTVRGLHYQIMPHGQSKLIRVVRGRIFDVVLDIRRTSKSFGHHVSVELAPPADGTVRQLYIPPGFAHGFCTLEPETEIIYKFGRKYAPDYERGILWNDAALGIDWPVDGRRVLVSDRDAAFSPLSKQVDLYD